MPTCALLHKCATQGSRNLHFSRENKNTRRRCKKKAKKGLPQPLSRYKSEIFPYICYSNF